MMYGQNTQEQSSISKFNESVRKLERLNVEQAKINITNLNLMGIDEETGLYNFQVKFNCLNTIFAEISAELTGKELKDAKDLRKSLREKVKVDLVFKDRMNHVTKESVKTYEKDKWNKVEDLLFEYELLMKKLMKIHGISFKDDDDPSLAGYR